jgi:hypothetical protein
MATFLFQAASLSSLAASKTYYLQAVATTPLASFSTIANIPNLLSTPQVLTGATYINQVFNFSDQVFNTRTYTSPHVGFVLAERIGAFFANSDPLIAFIPYTNAFGQEVIQPIGTYAIPIDFEANGLFTGIDAWQYQVGTYINNGLDQDLFLLIGTKNNTVAYQVPLVDVETLSNVGSPRSGLLVGGAVGVTLYSPLGQTSLMIQFRGAAEVLFGANGQLLCTGSIEGLAVSASNFLQEGWTAQALANNSNWTSLVNLNSAVSPLFSTGGVFYKYLKLELTTNTTYNYLDNAYFYGCSIKTPYQNFV